jgi:putative ABC transport system ATP-binding protein
MNGQDVYAQNDEQLAIFRRRHVGLIYQFYNLIPVLTVAENITLPVDLAHKKPDEKYLAELIETLGLTERIKYLPNQLSGGQQQRVAIGHALFNHPKIVLADEPTGNLDKKSGDEIVHLLKEANQKYHQTIILVTHDMSIAEKADRIITFEDGKIVSDQKKYHEEPKQADEITPEVEAEIEHIEKSEEEHEGSHES